MIKITFNKESEYQWIRKIIDNGVLNGSSLTDFFEMHGISTKQTVEYAKGENYIDDICETHKCGKDACTVILDELTDKNL